MTCLVSAATVAPASASRSSGWAVTNATLLLAHAHSGIGMYRGLQLLQELPTKVKGRKTPPPHRFAPTEIQGVKRDSLRIMLDMQKHIFSKSDLKSSALTKRVLEFFRSERYKKRTNEAADYRSYSQAGLNETMQATYQTKGTSRHSSVDEATRKELMRL